MSAPAPAAWGIPLTVGLSVEGRPLTLRLFDPAGRAALEGVALGCLLVGAFHGDEGLSARLLVRLVETLLAEGPIPWAGVPPFAVLPVFNPDGLALGTRVNARGVDLNRNYPTTNWRGDGEGTPYAEGPAPGSEPETQAMLALLGATQPPIIVSVHTPYRVVNYDGPAEALAEAMAEVSGYPAVASIGYPTPGSFGTYWGVERQQAVITVELPEPEPWDTPEVLAQVWQENEAALRLAIRWAASRQPVAGG